jgi:hypothetical protein
MRVRVMSEVSELSEGKIEVSAYPEYIHSKS